MGKQDKTRRETLQCLTHIPSPNGFTFQSCILNVKKFQCFSNGDISLKSYIATATMLRTKTHSPTWKEKRTTGVHRAHVGSAAGRPRAPGARSGGVSPDEGPRRPRLALSVPTQPVRRNLAASPTFSHEDHPVPLTLPTCNPITPKSLGLQEGD